jgi:hypothetical protein
MTTEELAVKTGVSPTTPHAKAKVIRDGLDICRMDLRFTTMR